MIKLVKIASLSPNNENEVTITLEKQDITCFITSSPYFLKIGQEYKAEITFFFLEDNCDIGLSASKSGFQRIGDGYSYYLFGKLQHGNLIVNNICFDDDCFLEFYDLDDKNVVVKVDRIDIAFL